MIRYFPDLFYPPSILEQCCLSTPYENKKSETFEIFSGSKVKMALTLIDLVKLMHGLEKIERVNLKFNMQMFAP